MKQIISIQPAYSQVVICDPTAKAEAPLWERDVPFVASDTCILLMCYPEIDGPTELAFGPGDEVRANLRANIEDTGPSDRLRRCRGRRDIQHADQRDRNPDSRVVESRLVP
jgi:hypothetical protein